MGRHERSQAPQGAVRAQGAVLSNLAARVLYALLHSDDGLGARDLSRLLDEPTNRVRVALAELAEQGLAERVRALCTWHAIDACASRANTKRCET